jgi:hypothetical protein
MAYFPNGSAGEVFSEQCSRCRYGEQPCPIYCAQYLHNYDACNVPVARAILDSLVKDDGTCMMFAMDETRFAIDAPANDEAERAYLELTPDTPPTIREIVLKAAGRIA